MPRLSRGGTAMTLEKVAVGVLALVGGVIGGALSGGAFRTADAAPRGGGALPPPVNPLNPLDPAAKAPTPLTQAVAPTVMTVPIGGLVFKSPDGKTLAKLQTHDGGALFSVYNAAGMVVASLGA